ncbi:MAG: pyroglutamyl-peptidase I [Oscillospiraceae bacterium]|nr:pyroglutamyl-peptidase I [Oscillospiraceae bacterium]
MNPKKLLITGFDPFGGESINPSWEAVKMLPDVIGDWQLTKLEVPTVFGKAGETVLAAAAQLQPDAVLCVGQAGGRAAITPELVAINLRFGRIADNAGAAPVDEPVAADGPAAYFSTLPVRAMAQAITEVGLPGQVSYSAGAFVCNDLLYTVLHHYTGTPVRAAFIHVPFLPQQAAEGVPSMTLQDIQKGLCAAIAVM